MCTVTVARNVYIYFLSLWYLRYWGRGRIRFSYTILWGGCIYRANLVMKYCLY
jgi:hypothetical protein